MAKLVRVTGISSVITKLRRAHSTIASGFAKGLKEAGLKLQRESQKIVPVDTSDLKGSANTRNVGGKGFDADVVVSYNTEYAVYVHEDMNAKHKPGKSAKYLEKPARENKKELIDIIKRKAAGL